MWVNAGVWVGVGVGVLVWVDIGMGWLVGWLAGCWEFYILATSKAIHRLVTMHTDGDFIVLPTGKSDCWHHDPISHSVTLS